MRSTGLSEASEGRRTLFLDVLNDASRWEGRTQGPGSVPPPGRRPTSEEGELRSGVRSSSCSKGGVLRGSGTMGGYNFVDGGLSTGKLSGPAEYKYEINVIGAVERTNNKRGVFGVPWPFVSYVIKVKRLPDGVSSVVSKRYSTIRGLVDNLLTQGLVDKSSVQRFPKKDIALSNNVEGERVVRRQKELQNFLQLLFMHHPQLWESEAVKVFMELDLMTSGEHFLEAELQHELSEHEATQAIAQAVREAEQAKSTQQQQHGETTERHRPALEAIGKLLTNAYNPLQQSVSGDRTQQQTTLPNELAVSQICSMGFKEDQARNALAAARNDPNLAVQMILDNERALSSERPGLSSVMNSEANQRSHCPPDHMSEPIPDLLSDPAIVPVLHPSFDSRCSPPASEVITRAPGDENMPNGPLYVSPELHNVNISRLYKNQSLKETGSAGPGTVDV